MSDIKETLKKIKALFADAPPAPPAGPPTPPPDDNMNTACYNVDGGQPVYVNISDDGIADIDVNDSVFSDAALTVPYPDGTYKVTGTSFGFTVAKGVVTVVDDAAGTGPGNPVTSAAPEDMSKKFAEQFAAINTQLTTIKTEFDAHKTAFAEAKKTIGTQQEAITQMLGVIEQLAKLPAGDPPAPPQNFKADAFKKKEEKLSGIASAIKDLKK